jgi:hypothetical protein
MVFGYGMGMERGGMGFMCGYVYDTIGRVCTLLAKDLVKLLASVRHLQHLFIRLVH